MGIFNKIKNFSKIGGNIGYIAQNMATFYYCLQNSDFGRSLTIPQLSYATALADLGNYYTRWNADPNDYRTDLESALTLPIMSLNGEFYDHSSIKVYGDYISLIYTTMEVEAIIFSRDTSTRTDEIFRQITQNKLLIADVINTTMNQGKQSPLYADIKKLSDVLLTIEAFKDYVLLVGNKMSEENKFEESPDLNNCYTAGARYCRKCGNKLVEGSAFCNKCGTKI